MSFRDDFFRTLNHEKPSEVPFDLRLCDSLMAVLKEKNSDNPSEYFDSGFRRVSIKPTKYPIDYTPYFEGLEKVDTITEWGLGLRGGSMYHLPHLLLQCRTLLHLKRYGIFLYLMSWLTIAGRALTKI
jgi:hypothetical protein